MGDQDRSPVPRLPASPEALDAQARAPVPECGLGTHSDPNVFCGMSPVRWSRPGVPTPVHEDQTREGSELRPVSRCGPEGTG
eukprot:3410896-Alexandrium_andersonii.AAC.1